MSDRAFVDAGTEKRHFIGEESEPSSSGTQYTVTLHSVCEIFCRSIDPSFTPEQETITALTDVIRASLTDAKIVNSVKRILSIPPHMHLADILVDNDFPPALFLDRTVVEHIAITLKNSVGELGMNNSYRSPIDKIIDEIKDVAIAKKILAEA